MPPKYIGGASRLGPMKAHAGSDQFCLVQVHRAVHAFLQAFDHGLFHLLRLGVVLLQTRESRFPLRQLRIGQGDVLYDRIPLVFVLKLGCMPVKLCRTQELPLRRIEDGTLRDDICQRRRRPFDAEGIPIGPPQA